MALGKDQGRPVPIACGQDPPDNDDMIAAVMRCMLLAIKPGKGAVDPGGIARPGGPVQPGKAIAPPGEARGKVALEHAIKRQCRDTAVLYGLEDHGLLARGYLADVNVIDLDRLALAAPEMVYDLPANGRRLSITDVTFDSPKKVAPRGIR